MPRGGEGAAGAEEFRAALDGVKGSTAGKGGMFDSTRLKRSQPWKRDGSQRTEILAGQVDPSGKFRGLAMTDVTMQSLLRYFQLSATCLPAAMPPSVLDMSQALEEGFPLIVVTRGVWGRELDQGVGPKANMNQDKVWAAARTARAENPRLLVTCVDVPDDMDADELEAVLRPPLNDYRELLYSDGSWYTPAVESAANVARQLKELAQAKAPGSLSNNSGVKFQRKKFEWRADESVNAMFTIIWKSVLEVKEAERVPRRSDLDFTERRSNVVQSTKHIPTFAEVKFKQAMANDEDEASKVEAVKAFLDTATGYEEASFAEALKVCKSVGKGADAAKAMECTYRIHVQNKNFDDAVEAADRLKGLCKDKEGRLAAVKKIVAAHVLKKKFDDAVAAATAAQAEFKKDKDTASEVACLRIAVSVHNDRGDIDDALSVAKKGQEAFKKASDKKGEGLAWLVVGAVNLEKSDFDAALKAQKEAKKLLDKEDECEAMEAIVKCNLASGETSDAVDDAKALLKAAKATKSKTREAAASALVCRSILVSAGKSMLSEGDESEMLDAGKSAVSLFEDLDDKTGLAGAQECYANALLRSRDSDGAVDQALTIAQASVATFKAAGGGAGLSAALLCCGQANLQKGNAYSAMWDAKQAVTNAQKHGDQASQQASMSLMQQAGEGFNKDVQVGPYVPVTMPGDAGTNVTMYV